MDDTRILSGYQLVSKGVTTKDGSLPEHGLKGVTPSGTWLEQKQIQSALEARKHLIEVERIEKRGNLSHAVWKDDLKLAEVIKKVGGHWQYLGFNMGKQLYLRPEETLFLMELNCLLLKHNEITVSLQKAYSLCLREISMVQYKVYASLSRLGYRVLRHEELKSHDKSFLLTASEKKQMTSEDIVVEHSILSEHGSVYKEQLNVISKEENPATYDYEVIPTNNNVSDKGEINNGIHNKDINEGTESKVEGTNKVSNDSTERNKNSSVVKSSNTSDSLVPSIDSDKIKLKTTENYSSMEIIDKDLERSSPSGIEPRHDFKSTGDEMPLMDIDINMPVNDKNADVSAGCDKTGDQEINFPTFKQEMLTYSVNDNNINITETRSMDIDDNANETMMITAENNINNITNDRIPSTNEDAIIKEVKKIADNIYGSKDTEQVVYSVDENGVVRVFGRKPPNQTNPGDFVGSAAANSNIEECNAKDPDSVASDPIKQYDKEVKRYIVKIQRLVERKSKTGERRNFDGLPDFYQQQIVKVNDPPEDYLPRNIFLHKSGYVLNIDRVRNQNASNANVGDERELTETSPPQPSRDATSNFPTLTSQFVQHYTPSAPRYSYQPFYRPSPRWRPRTIHNQNMFYGYNSYRMTPPNYYFPPRYRFQPRPFVRQNFVNYTQNAPSTSANTQSDTNKGNSVLREFHYNAIVSLASRFKTTMCTPSQVRALSNLLNTFNSQYNAQLEVTKDFDIVTRSKQDEVREVIVLDDIGEPRPKKSRLNDADETINNNLEKLKVLAAKLRDLHMKNLAVSRHRRVFSNAIKTFNKSFKADLYLDSNFEIKDRKLIVLDSSSDSDVVVSVIEKNKSKKRKKLRNPYNILKRVSKDVNDGASTSWKVPVLQSLALNVINASANKVEDITNENNTSTNGTKVDFGEGLLRYFDKGWLPSDDDFGRAELCSRINSCLIDVSETEYLNEVIKKSASNFENWLDLKIAVLKDIQECLDIQRIQAEALNKDFLMETESQIQPIIKQDCTDLRSALKQLAIIKTNIEIPTESSLRIHYDVCNRDKHFKKTSPPKPNFRVICLDESAAFPSGTDVACLQSKYEDGVPIVFAFVGNCTSSITYLQIKVTNLPVYIPENDMV